MCNHDKISWLRHNIHELRKEELTLDATLGVVFAYCNLATYYCYHLLFTTHLLSRGHDCRQIQLSLDLSRDVGQQPEDTNLDQAMVSTHLIRLYKNIATNV
ncbi:hypothetical protein RRG08_035839 [Elysia crispata]|uniref:Uncharacterized protein n=1 Tax=Elysia crispata TaxID=231223 RepID=A0AAE1DAD2_9GAST|nr:hypothetical protein RRG08_035839 [Elysia crispata]